MSAILTNEQLSALIRFKETHGRHWKSELRTLWATGKDEKHTDAALLRQVRNEIGPHGLDRIEV